MKKSDTFIDEQNELWTSPWLLDKQIQLTSFIESVKSFDRWQKSHSWSISLEFPEEREHWICGFFIERWSTMVIVGGQLSWMMAVDELQGIGWLVLSSSPITFPLKTKTQSAWIFGILRVKSDFDLCPKLFFATPLVLFLFSQSTRKIDL
jgi:hypothetical protein